MCIRDSGYSVKFGNLLSKTRQNNIFPCKIWTPQYRNACWTENYIAVNSSHSWGGETCLSDREQQGLAAPQRSLSHEPRGAVPGLCHHQLAQPCAGLSPSGSAPAGTAMCSNRALMCPDMASYEPGSGSQRRRLSAAKVGKARLFLCSFQFSF